MNGRRTISFLLVLALVFSLLPVSVLAASGVASVNGETYTSVKSAWNAVKNGGTIDLLADWNLKALYDDCLTVEKNASVTVNLNGHMIDRGLANTRYYGYGDGQIFYVKDNASLTVNGGDTSIRHGGYVQGHLWFPGGNGSETLTGGVLTGGACDDSDGAGAITIKKNAIVTLNNVTVAGNLADCYGALYGHAGAIRMHNSGSVLNLNDTKIVYNHAEDNGGGIYIDDDNCLVNMSNSEISHNFACDDGGGIYSNDVKTTIKMSNGSKIEYNSADAGAGIYFNYAQFVLKSEDATASISHNQATSGDGGAIHIQHDRSWLFFGNTNSGSIYGVRFDKNTASGYGGAVYIQQESVAVSGCEITNNSAQYGGGIYVNNDLNSVSGCTITGNRVTSAGGGIYTSSMNDFALSGKVIIKDNKRSDDSADDLFLNSTWATTSYLTASPTGQSEIGIRMDSPQERKLGKNQQFYFENAFFYDGDDYHIEFKEDKAELWLVKGAKTKVTPIEVSSPTVETMGYTENDYPVYRGYFSYPSVAETTEDLDAVFFYSDGYFLSGSGSNNGEPKYYNTHLATMSMAMAMAGFYSNIGNDGALNGNDDRTYTYKSQNIERLLTDIGVKPEDIFISDSNTVKPGTNTIGVAIGQKTIGATEEGYILVPIAVRGAGYESEWYGNTTVGTSGEHKGFATAADQVFKQVQNYIRDYGLTEAVKAGKVKFWIAGYSRAGATSNLTAKRLIEAYCDGTSTAMNNQVYAYCFEAPKGGVNSAMKLDAEKYYGIHNCINKADVVPLVAPEEMGFIRYGVDHYIPGGTAGLINASSNVWSYVKTRVSADKGYMTWYDNTAYTTDSEQYKAQRRWMLEQLKSVDPTNIYFYDNFRMAQVNYIRGAIGATDMFDPITDRNGKNTITQEEFARVFVRALQSWGFYRSYDADFRDGYTGQFKNSGGKVGVSFEYALQTVTKIFFSKSAAELNGMMDAASGTMDRLSFSTLLKIYDNMIGDWTTLSQSKRESYLQMLWDAVMEGAPAGGKSAASYLTVSEKAELRASWNVLLDVLLRFVEVDYNTSVDKWNSSKTVVGNTTTPIMEGVTSKNEYYCDGSTHHTQVMLGTLAYNATALMEAHYPEINFAWLRSYDSFYTDEAKGPVEIQMQSAPSVTAEQADDGTVTLTANPKGAAVFYRLKTNDGGYSVWRPYNLPLTLDGGKTYTMQYTAVYCGAVSAVQEKSLSVSTAKHYTVTVDGKYFGSYQEGDIVTVDARTLESKCFVTWKGDDLTKIDLINGSVSESPKLTQAITNPTISFKMPAENLSFETETVDRVGTIALTVSDAGETSKILIDGKSIDGVDPSQLVFNYSVGAETSAVQTQSMPDVESGTAAEANTEEAVTITATALLNPSREKDIYFSKSTTATINDKPCGVSYNSHDGSVTLTAETEKTVQPDEYCTVTVKCVDRNLNKVDTTFQYRVKKDQELTLAAPSVQDERFVAWAASDGLTIDGRKVTLTPAADLTIQADYIPVVKKIDITIAEPAVGEELPAEVNSVKVTVTNEYDIDADSIFTLWINWLDPDFGVEGKVKAGDWYVAALYFMPSSNEQFNYNYTLADDVQLTVNGTPLTNDFLVWVGKSDPAIFFVYEAGTGFVTTGNELLSVVQPEPIVLANGATLSLPSSVGISVADGSVTSAAVNWNSYSYTPSDEPQSFVVTGTVQYGNNPNKVSTAVSQSVIVEGAAQAEAPVASRESGSYSGSVSLTLSTETEGAEIYYTLDGSDPTASSTRYTGGRITLTSSKTLTAVAVKSGLRNSDLAMYSYTIERSGSSGGGSGSDDDHGSGGGSGSGSGSTAAKPAEKPAETTAYDTCAHGADCPLRQFTDLGATEWYHNGVHYCLDHGLMNGYTVSSFGPNDNVSRAQTVTILWRLAGSPEGTGALRFTDTAEGAYYAAAVRWAAENDIVGGYSDGRFGVNDPITREQLAAMFYRFAKYQSRDVSVGEDTNILSYNDATDVSNWAMSALQWACGAGLINGVSGGKLLPQGSATRAQMATILMRFCEGAGK